MINPRPIAREAIAAHDDSLVTVVLPRRVLAALVLHLDAVAQPGLEQEGARILSSEMFFVDTISGP
jgi:hypothetical protein